MNYPMNREEGWNFTALFCMAMVLLFLILGVCTMSHAYEVDLRIISAIESSDNPLAYNKKADACGSYQITPICLKEYNTMSGAEKVSKTGLFEPKKARLVADWYFNKRIPQMLKVYGIKDTIQNRIWCYNAGIKNCKNRVMPLETKNYIAKYYRIGERLCLIR